MSLENIDDLFSEQPLKIDAGGAGVEIDDKDVEDLKKELIKDEYKNALEKRKFGIKKLFGSIREFFTNTEVRYYVMLLKIAVVILLLVFSYFMIMQAVNKVRGRNALKIDLVQPKTFVNNANNIYVDHTFYIDGVKNVLLKIQIDTLATKFYFERSIDREKFTPVLIDENGYYYIYDYDYAIDEGTSNDIVVFEGLRSGIENFRLIFVKSDSLTQNTIDNVFFDFKMEEPIFKTPVKYYSTPFDLDSAGEHFDLEVQNAVFSSAKSELYFDVEYKEDGAIYDFSKERIEESIYMNENGFRIPYDSMSSSVDTVDISEVYDDNSKIVIGKLSFEVLKDLNSKITVGFENFHRLFKLNDTLNLRGLLLSDITEEEVYKLDHYTFYLEGAKKYDNLLVLVAHCDNENYKRPTTTISETDENGVVTERTVFADEPQDPERVEVIVDATLSITLPDGSVEVVEGVPVRSRLGTDVKFESENISNATSSNMKLVLNKVTVIEDGGEFVLNLREADSQLDPAYQEYIDFVEKSLADRLRYKSNELLFSQLNSFSDEVLNDPYLSAYYAPLELDTRANFAVDVKNYSVDDRGNFVCNVTEEWYGRIDNASTNQYNKHQIIVTEVDGKKQIIYDKIVKE